MLRICVDMDEVMADTLAEYLRRYNQTFDEEVTPDDLAGKGRVARPGGVGHRHPQRRHRAPAPPTRPSPTPPTICFSSASGSYNSPTPRTMSAASIS